MGKTFSTGLLTNGIWQDASNNIGIGGSPSGSYKLEVTGTAKVSSTLLVSGALTGTNASFVGTGDFSSGALTLTLGADNGLTTRTNLTQKIAKIVSYNYTNANNPVGMMVANNDGTDNALWIGGGSGATIAATNIQFYTAANNNTATGTARMTINSAGNVGIGTSTPTNFGAANTGLSINGAGGNAGLLDLQYNGTSGMVVYSDISGTTNYESRNLYMRFGTNNTERMRITSGGYLKATTTGTYEVSPTGAYYEFDTNSTNSTLYAVNLNAAGSGFSANINSSSDSYTFFNGYSISAGAVKAAIYTSGKFGSSTSTYGSLISDARLKENIIDATPKLEDILKLRVVNFNLIGDETKQIGFIAQEFKKVFPSLISVRDTREFDDDGKLIKGLEDTMSVNVGMDFAILTKVIQELNQTITSLQDRLDKAGL